MDKYKVLPPGGGSPFVLEVQASITVAGAYEEAAERLGCSVTALSLAVRNRPGAALPFFHLRAESDETLRRVVPPGSVLVAELDGAGAEQGGIEKDADLESALQASLSPAVLSAEAPAAPTPDATGAAMPAPAARDVLPEEGRGLLGLCNLGNTCYLNSAVQCLSQLGPFREALLSAASGKSGEKCYDIALECRNLLLQLWSEHGGQAPAPRELKRLLAERVPFFKGFEQQDSAELLGVLLEALHEGLRRPSPSKEPASTPPAAADDVSGAELALASWHRAEREDASPISDLFQGQLQSTVRCQECKHEETTFELFWSLPLPVPPQGSNGDEILLSDALDAFCAEETLDGDAWQCPHCKRAVRASKRFALWRLPKVLQLHLKRFKWHEPEQRPPPYVQETKAPTLDAKRAPLERTTDEPAADVASKDVSGDAAPAPQCAEKPDGAPSSSLQETAGAQAGAAKEDQKPTITPANVLQEISDRLPWEDQEKMFMVVHKLLDNISKNPEDIKFRSVGRGSAKLRRDLLDLEGGCVLLEWAGFEERGERLDASELPADVASARATALAAHFEQARDRHLRRERDRRIEAERRRRLPTGDTTPIRRWGGRLPARGWGYGGTFGERGLRCTKVEARLTLPPDASRARGLAPLRLLDAWLAPGSPAAAAAATGAEGAASSYELCGVVEHQGSTPFSGHYLATCWHAPSSAWARFNDASVSKMPAASISSAVLTHGSYVMFLERTC